MRETWIQSLGREDPRRREWQPTPVFLPRESHGQRSLVEYSPWGCKELDTTEQPTHTHTHNYKLSEWESGLSVHHCMLCISHPQSSILYQASIHHIGVKSHGKCSLVWGSEPLENKFQVILLGEAHWLKLPTLARHHSNHVHELFYNRRSW